MLIQPKKSIKATVTVPGDKAISHKALIISAIAEGVSEIEGFLINEDSITAIDCLRKLNVGVELFAKRKA
jgi:3-phosphoshikimate 1-carboxyvinyltransferase